MCVYNIYKFNLKKLGGKRNIVIINWESEQKSGTHRPKHSVQMMRKMRKGVTTRARVNQPPTLVPLPS
jgi:hypothetical protein